MTWTSPSWCSSSTRRTCSSTTRARPSCDSIEQTVRLIRSKGIGVFFVTQTPKDVPSGVLSQLGNRVQHALRAFTPEDAKALKATVSTFPRSGYDLGELLTQLGTGEAVVTVLSDRGAPTPVAWTRMRAPQSLMAPSPEAVVTEVVASSALSAKYAEVLDRESAYERLQARLAAAPAPDGAPAPAAPAPAPAPRRARAQGAGVGRAAGARLERRPLDAALGRLSAGARDHPQPVQHRTPPPLRRVPARRP